MTADNDEEDKKKPELEENSIVPDTRAEDIDAHNRSGSKLAEEADRSQSKERIAVAKVPSTDATEQLQFLLGTVGNAGLGATFTKPEPEDGSDKEEKFDTNDSPPPPLMNPASLESPVSAILPPPAGDVQPKAGADLNPPALNDAAGNGNPLTARFEAFANIIPNKEDRELFQKNIQSALDELSSGQLGPATLALFAQASKSKIHEAFKDAFLRQAGELNGCSIEDRSTPGKPDEISLRVKGNVPGLVQNFDLKIQPGQGATIKDSSIVQNNLDLDPLTSRFSTPEFNAKTGQPYSTAQQAKDLGIPLPQSFTPERLAEMRVPVPGDFKQNPNNPAVGKMTVGEFAKAAGLEGHNLNDYYQAVFYKTNDPKLRQEAMQGLRDEVNSGKNPSSLAILQQLSAHKAAIELKQAEANGDKQVAFRALTQLASLESSSQLAQDILNGSDGKRGGMKGEAHPLADAARQAARDIATQTFAPANAAYGSFLSRDVDKADPEQRHDMRESAIKRLEKAGEQRLNLMARDDFSYLTRNLKSIDAVMTIGETKSPTLAAEQIRTLLTMADVHKNTSAISYLHQTETALRKQPGAPTLDQLEKDLASGGARAEKALALLKSSIPDMTGEMNNYRLDQIMKGLSTNSSSADMQQASKLLEEELKFGNSGAKQLLDWTSTGESTQKLSEALNSRNLDDIESVKAAALVIKSEMDRLSKLSQDGNTVARSALMGMLVHGTDKASQDEWKFSQEGRGPLVPDLSKLSAAESSIVRQHSALAINETLKKNPNATPLFESDGAALGKALIESKVSGNTDLQKAVEAVLGTALKTSSREPIGDGLIKAMDSEKPGAEILSETMLKIATDGGLTDKQFRHLSMLSRYDNEGALRTIAGIAGGATTPEQAASAAYTLKEAGKNSSNRDHVLNVMLESYKNKGDSGALLAAMGDVAARDNPASAKAMQLIRDAFESSSKNTNSAEYKSARAGFLSLAENWEKKDIEALGRNLRPDMMEELPALASKLNPELRSQFIKAQHEVVTTGSPEERLAAVQALSAFAKYAGPEIASELAFFATPRGKAELTRAGLSEAQSTQFLDVAGKTLLGMMGSSNPKVQDAAYESFRRKADWPGLLGSQELREKIIAYAQGRSMDLELNKEAMHLVYGAGLGRPLAGQFKDLGVGGDKISTQQLFQLAERAAANYSSPGVDGKTIVQQVLNNATTINALPPHLREKLTGSSAGIDMSQLAAQLAKGSIDANHPPKNALFTDVDKWLKQQERETDDKLSKLQTDYRNTEKFRSTALTALGKHTKEDRVGLGSRFADTFMGTDFVGDFEKNQGMNVRRIATLDARLGTLNAESSKAKADLAYIHLAQQASRHFELSTQNQKAADKMLMDMVAKHGPAVLAQFTRSNFEQIPAAMERLKLNQAGNLNNLPDYSGKDGFKRALADLPGIQYSAGKEVAADYHALQKVAFEKIDSLPAFGKIQASSAEVAARLPVLQEMFSSGMQGSRFKEFVDTAKKHASEIKAALDSVKPEDLAAAREALKEMKETLKNTKDETIAKQLQDRIKGYEGALDLFGGAMGGQVRNMLNEILNKDSFDETTFKNWLIKDGPVVAASLVAAAAVIALTAGAATPIVVAGLIVAPAAAMTAGELTKEGLQWGGLRKEGSLLGEMARGMEVYDEKTKQMRKMTFDDVAGSYAKQYAQDLAISVATMGLGNVLAKGISKVGQATFGKMLAEKGAGLADLAKGLEKAEAIAAAGGQKGFVKEFFHQIALQSSFATKQAVGEDLLQPLMEGHLDKYGPLLVSLAICTIDGCSFAPKKGFTEFNLKNHDLAKAPEILNKQLLQLHNDGFTIKMREGGAFEAIDAKGRSTEFRPSEAVAAKLKDYKAPEWVTNANGKAVIAQIQLGELASKTRANTELSEPSQVRAERVAREKTAAGSAEKELLAARQRDVYHPEIPPPSPEMLARINEHMPEMSGKSIAEFDTRLKALQESWTDDHNRDLRRLRLLEPEYYNAKYKYDDVVLATKSSDAFTNQLLTGMRADPSYKKMTFTEKAEYMRTREAAMIAELEKNPAHPLGKAKQEYDALNHEYETLNNNLATTLNARKAELQKELDFMHEKHGWPKVQLKSRENLEGSAGAYNFGAGELYLPTQSILAAHGATAHRTVFHELIHAAQDRSLAEYSLHKAGGDQAKATEIYKDLTGRTAQSTLIAEAAKNPQTKNWTAAAEARVKELAKDLKENPSNLAERSSELFKKATFIEGRLYSLNRDSNKASLEHLFGHLSSKEHGEKVKAGLFPDGMPPQVELALKEWKSSRENGTEFRRDEALATVKAALEAELAKVNKEHTQLAKDYFSITEQEAWGAESPLHYDKFSKPGAAPATPSGVTPFEAIKAITAASAVKGDSLHPDSRGWEATRSMYDKKLQDGTMNAEQAKKLLAMAPEDRGQIEFMLKNDRLSKAAFDGLMKLDASRITEALSVPQRTFNNVILPSLERGIIDGTQLNKLLSQPDSHRRASLSFLEKAVADPHQSLSPELVARFLDLPQSSRTELANSMNPQPKGVASLSTEDAAMLLSTPVRKSSGVDISDAPALAKALQNGVIDRQGIKDFSNLDEPTRSGLSILLSSNMLSAEQSKSIMEKLGTGEMTGAQVKDLGTAHLLGWLPEGTLTDILKQDLPLRKALFERLAIEAHSGKRESFSVTDFMQRMKPIEELRKQGVINEPTMRILATPHGSDLLISGLLASQSKKAATERVAKENLQQLVSDARQGKISPETLSSYKTAIENGSLDRNTAKSMLALSPDTRQGAEKFMNLAPQEFAKLAREGKFAEMAERASKLEYPAHSIFPDMFPEGGKFDFKQPETIGKSSDTVQEISKFTKKLDEGDLVGALNQINAMTKSADSPDPTSTNPELRWVEKRIKLSELNNPEALNTMLSSILANGKAMAEQPDAYNPNATNKVIKATDPIIQLPDNKEFRLRDSSTINDNGKQRATTPQEKAFIESIQKSESGKALIGKTAMVLMEEWGHSKQTSSGGLSRLTSEFEHSPEYQELKKYWEKKSNNPDASIREALREIDIAASLREGGLSTKAVEKILGDQHMSGEREFFYRFLKRTDSPTGERLPADASSKKPGTARELNPGNFEAISNGKATMEFPNGMKAEISMTPENFKKVEAAYNTYMTELAEASKLFGIAKAAKMGELAKRFDTEFAPILQEAGVRVGESFQPAMQPVFDVQMSNRYTVPKVGGPAQGQPIDLTTQQGIRRFLAEHPDGQRIYRELSSVRNSGFNATYDPSNKNVRPPNPSDRTALTDHQRSALAVAILNDTKGTFRVAYKTPEGSDGAIQARTELTVFKHGDEGISNSRAAFNRAEEWSHLMFTLNNNKPISQGGKIVAELEAKGELNGLQSPGPMLIIENDFMQTLKELGIKPDQSLWEAQGYYRQEVDALIEAQKAKKVAAGSGAH